MPLVKAYNPRAQRSNIHFATPRLVFIALSPLFVHVFFKKLLILSVVCRGSENREMTHSTPHHMCQARRALRTFMARSIFAHTHTQVQFRPSLAGWGVRVNYNRGEQKYISLLVVSIIMDMMKYTILLLKVRKSWNFLAGIYCFENIS